jgi:hypothetical protein
MPRGAAIGLVGALMIAALEHGASAQSLAELARRAGAKPAASSGKVLTNADLPDVERETPMPVSGPTANAPSGGSSPDDATAPAAASASEPSPTEPPVMARTKRDEAYWRARGRDLRGRLERITADAAALTERLAALDAAPTASARQERLTVEKSLNRLRSDEAAMRAEIAGFEARARAENVPPAWLH